MNMCNHYQMIISVNMEKLYYYMLNAVSVNKKENLFRKLMKKCFILIVVNIIIVINITEINIQ